MCHAKAGFEHIPPGALLDQIPNAQSSRYPTLGWVVYASFREQHPTNARARCFPAEFPKDRGRIYRGMAVCAENLVRLI